MVVYDNNIVMHSGHIKNSTALFEPSVSAASGRRTWVTYFFLFV